MAFPSSFTSLSLDGSLSSGIDYTFRLYYVNGQCIIVASPQSYETSGNLFVICEPASGGSTGSWQVNDLGAVSGYSGTRATSDTMDFDGTHYVFTRLYDTGHFTDVYYATDPMGTWSTTTISGKLVSNVLWDGSQWLLTGSLWPQTGTTNKHAPALGYGATITGSLTWIENPTGQTISTSFPSFHSTTRWIGSIATDGDGGYVLASNVDSATDPLWYSTTPTTASSWTNITDADVTYSGTSGLVYVNGIWTCITSGTYSRPAWSSGTWPPTAWDVSEWSGNTNAYSRVSYWGGDGGYFYIDGSATNFYIYYDAPPLTATWPTTRVLSPASYESTSKFASDGYLIAAANGALYRTTTAIPLGAVRASTLRQRQSPRRSPSRVGWY